VNASKVVTFPSSAPAAVDEEEEEDGVIVVVVVVVVVGAAGGGVEDWACNPMLKAHARQNRAGYFRSGFLVFRCMMSLVVRYLEGRVAPSMPRLYLKPNVRNLIIASDMRFTIGRPIEGLAA
jgi:hypothetical protein